MGSKLMAAPKDLRKKSVKSTIQADSVNPLKKPIDQQQADVDEGTLTETTCTEESIEKTLTNIYEVASSNCPSLPDSIPEVIATYQGFSNRTFWPAREVSLNKNTKRELTGKNDDAVNLQPATQPMLLSSVLTPSILFASAIATIAAYQASQNETQIAAPNNLTNKLFITISNSVLNAGESATITLNFDSAPGNTFNLSAIKATQGNITNLRVSSNDPKVYLATYEATSPSVNGLVEISLNFPHLSQPASQYVFVTDTIASRINPKKDGHFQTQFYSSTSAATSGIEQLSALGGIGPDYGGSKNFSSDIWTKLQTQGLNTPFLFTFPGTYTAVNSGTSFSATNTEIYNAFYAQAYSAIQNSVANQVISSWYLPEEMRPWVTRDMDATRSAVSAIRRAETDLQVAPRPIQEYQPNHADVARLDSFHGLFDVISKGSYVQIGNPTLHSSTLLASQYLVKASRGDIGQQANAGAVGKDFTPYLALGASTDPVAGTSVEGFKNALRLDFYAAISQGIQGINIWSYATRAGFSSAWRDEYFNEYIALSREVNEILPDFGKAITQGARFENTSGSFPITADSDNTNAVSARFFYDGKIYLLLVNTDLRHTANFSLSGLGNFTQSKEVLVYNEAAWQQATTTLELGAESVKVFEFADPDNLYTPAGNIPQLKECSIQFKKGISNSNQVLTAESLQVSDTDQRGASNIQIDVWGGNQFGSNNFANDYFFTTNAPTVEITQFTLADLQAGRVSFHYSGHQANVDFSLRVTDDRGLTSGWKYFNIPFFSSRPDSAGGQLIFGDGSGSGGSGGYSTGNGGAGGGDDDVLNGTEYKDVIFGDGSGGGEGPCFGSGRATGRAGLAGGGNDSIYSGAGDDIVFGDGFNGTENIYSAASSFKLIGTKGGYGGGGSGGGETTGSIGGGGGGSTLMDNTLENTFAGQGNTVGVFKQVKAAYTGNNHLLPGSGLGVSANGNSSVNGDTSQISAYLSEVMYDKVALDISGSGGDERVFTQEMGAGDDFIDAGAGDDFVMGGYGNDFITCGSGNDTMWGRGGSISATLTSDSDIFKWNAGDAGANGAIDTIKDFVHWNGSIGDKIQITGLLQGFNANSSDLQQWVNLYTGVTVNGSVNSSKLVIDIDGLASNLVTQIIQLENVDLSGFTLNQLVSSAVIICA